MFRPSANGEEDQLSSILFAQKKISLTSMSQAFEAPPGVRTGNSNLHNAKMFACFKVVGSDRGGEGGGGGRPFLRRPDVFCNRPARDS